MVNHPHCSKQNCCLPGIRCLPSLGVVGAADSEKARHCMMATSISCELLSPVYDPGGLLSLSHRTAITQLLPDSPQEPKTGVTSQLSQWAAALPQPQ